MLVKPCSWRTRVMSATEVNLLSMTPYCQHCGFSNTALADSHNGPSSLLYCCSKWSNICWQTCFPLADFVITGRFRTVRNFVDRSTPRCKLLIKLHDRNICRNVYVLTTHGRIYFLDLKTSTASQTLPAKQNAVDY